MLHTVPLKVPEGGGLGKTILNYGKLQDVLRKVRNIKDFFDYTACRIIPEHGFSGNHRDDRIKRVCWVVFARLTHPYLSL
jgi:hypothetical protein